MIRRSQKIWFAIALLCVLSCAMPLWGDFPKPSTFPVSWELTMTHGKPKRFLFKAEGDSAPVVYWYITYHVANNTDRDKVMFYPTFEMMTEDGTITRSDFNISPSVYDAIREREHLKFMVDANHVNGELLQGEDQSKDSVAVWVEPKERMGSFTLFVRGFWGETAKVKAGDKDVTLFKTLQLTYHVNGDNSAVNDDEKSEYVMR